MSALRDLAAGDRVAHREDHNWKDGDGIVTAVLGADRYAVKWPDFHKPQEHSRGDLVAMDDPDIDSDDDEDEVALSPGQTVVADGASAIVGDVLSVDEANGTAVIAWRPTTTTEQISDLRTVSA